MPLTVDLPEWNPTTTPEVVPPPRTAAWVPRIGAPGAIFLGKVRPRLIGAATSAVFVPVGAVRLLIGLSSSRSATDPWGPADAFVILIAAAGLVGVYVFVQSARAFQAKAAHAAQVLLRQGNPGVSEAQLAPLLRSTASFDRWAEAHGVAPLATNATAVNTSSEGARLLFARSTRGSFALWVPRFGESLSRAFRATRVQAWIGIVFALGAVVIAGVALIGAEILVREGHPNAIRDLSPLVTPLIVVFVIGLIFVLVSRYGPRGRYAIADSMVPVLASRDPKVTRNMVGAMFARPYMYDMWVLKHR